MYEGLRNNGTLTVLDTVEAIASFKMNGAMVVFFSYEWLSWSKQGPNSVQFAMMKQAITNLANKLGTNICNFYIWLDILSIPQVHAGLKTLAINTLYSYARHSDVMVIVAPDSFHEGTKSNAGAETYKDRAWTRTEQVAHCAHHGIESMYIQTHAGLSMVTKSWMEAVVCIFDGHMTCCRMQHPTGDRCNKESLVPPLLALYYDLYTQHGRTISTPMSNSPFFIWSLIKERKKHIFPASIQYTAKDGATEQRVLFGDMIARLERFVDNEIREKLRGGVQYYAKRLRKKKPTPISYGERLDPEPAWSMVNRDDNGEEQVRSAVCVVLSPEVSESSM